MTHRPSLELAEALFELDKQEQALQLELADLRRGAVERGRDAALLTMIDALRRRNAAAIDLLEDPPSIEYLRLDRDGAEVRGRGTAPARFESGLRGLTDLELVRHDGAWSLSAAREPPPPPSPPEPATEPTPPATAVARRETPEEQFARRRRELAELRAQVALASMFGLGSEPGPRVHLRSPDADEVDALLGALAAGHAGPKSRRAGREHNAWRQPADAWRVSGRVGLPAFAAWLHELQHGRPLIGFEELIAQRDGDAHAVAGLLLSYRA